MTKHLQITGCIISKLILNGRRRSGDQQPLGAKYYASEISWWRFRADPFPDQRTIYSKSPFIELQYLRTFNNWHIAQACGERLPDMRSNDLHIKLG